MSLRKAINDKCRDCIYDPQSGLGTWREQISRCTMTDCPLWPVRTGPKSGPYTRAKMDVVLRGGAESATRADIKKAAEAQS